MGPCGCSEAYCSNYYTDSSSVYVDFEKNEEIDPLTFEYLGTLDATLDLTAQRGIAYDKNNIYFGCANIVPGLKPDERHSPSKDDGLRIWDMYDYYELSELTRKK